MLENALFFLRNYSNRSEQWIFVFTESMFILTTEFKMIALNHSFESYISQKLNYIEDVQTKWKKWFNDAKPGERNKQQQRHTRKKSAHFAYVNYIYMFLLTWLNGVKRHFAYGRAYLNKCLFINVIVSYLSASIWV